MISKQDIFQLSELQERIRKKYGEFRGAEVTPIAEELGLDVGRIMDEVGRICDSGNYPTGTSLGMHIFCTRCNVLPIYKQGKLVLDMDHAEGLKEILRIGLRDY